MLDFLYTAVSWVLLRWHDLFTALGLSSTSGAGWALSIVFLVITARLLLFRLFVKQVHYQRNMQKMQPKIQKLREKYKNDRAELNRQMMKFQQEEGFNPLSGCLPMFLQIPVFIGLYHVLRHLSNSNALCQKNSNSSLLTQYTFSKADTCGASTAKIFGSPLAASFHDSGSVISQLGGDAGSTRIVLVILLIISAGATYATQLLVRSNQTTVPEGNAATIQRAMLYLIPVGTLASGLLFNFPLGVLLYWFTSNLWTLGQQAFIIKFHPPTDDDVALQPAGEVGKTLAPRPGQRPVRMAKGKPDTISTSKTSTSKSSSSNGSAGDGKISDTSANGGSAGNGANGAGRAESAARGAVPRPGQRPNRPERQAAAGQTPHPGQEAALVPRHPIRCGRRSRGLRCAPPRDHDPDTPARGRPRALLERTTPPVSDTDVDTRTPEDSADSGRESGTEDATTDGTDTKADAVDSDAVDSDAADSSRQRRRRRCRRR